MASRLKLHEELCEILGTNKVYFNPPQSVRMTYPCIKYSKSKLDQKFANNKTYTTMNGYEVIVIDPNPDCDSPDKIIANFERCRFDRSYIADNLYHTVFTIYY